MKSCSTMSGVSVLRIIWSWCLFQKSLLRVAPQWVASPYSKSSGSAIASTTDMWKAVCCEQRLQYQDGASFGFLGILVLLFIQTGSLVGLVRQQLAAPNMRRAVFQEHRLQYQDGAASGILGILVLLCILIGSLDGLVRE